MEAEEELGMKEPTFLADAPVFHARTLTQGVNAGHIDVTTWLLVAGTAKSGYRVQEKEATQSGWIDIDELLRTSTLAHLHRGFRKIREIAP
mgnify:CR=1 FL=1